MAVNNTQLQELVDRAVPPGGTVNCETLHKLLHMIVSNLACPTPPKTDFKCTVGTKSSEENVSEMVKELRNMVEMQRKLISELHLKVQSLEKASAGRGRSRSRSRSKSRPTSRSSSKKSLTSARSRSCMGRPKSSGEWTTFKHPGKGPPAGNAKQLKRSTMDVRPKPGTAKSTAIPIPELKRWVDQKVRDLPYVDNEMLERINQLVKDKMKSTVVPDMQKMIETMISSAYKEQKGASSAGTMLPLCLSCQNAAVAGTSANQVSSQDCMCVIKRKMRNASSKMNLKKK